MASTAIVAMRRAVVAGVEVLPAFEGLSVMFAYKSTEAREFAFTRDATFDHQPRALKAGRHFRDETGRFEFVIWAQVPGGEPEDAEVRALELGVAFEEWVADHKDGAGVEGVFALQVKGGGQIRSGQTDRAAVAEVVYPVEYQARLT